MPWKTKLITRQELYREVWAEPVLQVASRYRISNVALSRICKKLNVPIPGRGHWARVAAGRAPAPWPLPPESPNQRSWYELRRWESPADDADFGEDARALLEAEKRSDVRIVVPGEIAEFHPTVRRYETLLRRSQKKLSDSFFVEHRCLDVRARGEALDRALRVANAIAEALDRRGFELEVTNPEPGVRDPYYGTLSPPKPSLTGARILGALVTFRIQEQYDSYKIHPVPPSRTAGSANYKRRPELGQRPNGKLTLQITCRRLRLHRKSWADAKVARIENCLDPFVQGLIEAAATWRAETRAEERAALARQREAERRAEEQRQQEIIEALQKDLKKRIQDWKYAEEIRRFSFTVETAARERDRGFSEKTDLGRWLFWAREQADHLGKTALEISVEELHSLK